MMSALVIFIYCLRVYLINGEQLRWNHSTRATAAALRRPPAHRENPRRLLLSSFTAGWYISHTGWESTC